MDWALILRTKSLKGNLMSDKLECICGEINARNCPVHQESEPREFTKVDRALEIQVIDWLQWAEFSEKYENLARLALELISKRKAELTEARAQRDDAIKRGSLITLTTTDDALTKELTEARKVIEIWADRYHDECAKSAKLVAALWRAKDVIDFCYMSQPKNKHQVEIEKALAEYEGGREG